MTIYIYDTLTQSKKEFQPLVPGKVGMYVCGVTVYDHCHLGHARFMVVFDTVARYLRYRDYDVTYVRNITDIDDKIINRANERGVSIEELTEEFTAKMHEDCAAIGCEPPDQEPKATGHIAEIIALIEKLDSRGYTYVTPAGDVYYRVRKFDGYGKLSKRSIDELRSGDRVDVDASKEDPLDFVLWKSAKPDEPYWESPWGNGRPGWHIECSAMSECCLGATFDIHAGGMDLQFPHHENEIAQSEAANEVEFARVWMHNGFVQVDEEKMSKSLGNFQTIREVLALDSSPQRMGEIIRYTILASHYRSPLNYTESLLDSARASLERMYMTLERAAREGIEPGTPTASGRRGMNLREDDDELERRFEAAMDDDFNTPEALAVLHDTVSGINRALDAGETDRAGRLVGTLNELAGPMGLLRLDPGVFLGTQGDAAEIVVGTLTRADIEARIEARVKARSERDFAEADRIRDELDALGITIEDVAGAQSTWRLKS